ncbi:nucleotidyl transferase AbiEii/AbiGii toxin family protein [Actinomycetospora sp. OC33-EN08]|uniref:Nucleotidyl transferase AbiEii/AbiGii toxin family protein n=1 Tax=Actinomycetospora aurantiaca TaxID=3129233 RepID=A0ABU8MHY9_9PSEU
MLLDLAVNGAALLAPVPTAVGQAFDPEELAAQKVLALFSRAEARDFVDVFVLSERFGTSLLLRRAAELDKGFDAAVLAEMIGSLDRFSDEDLPTDQPGAVRRFFRDWTTDLRS